MTEPPLVRVSVGRGPGRVFQKHGTGRLQVLEGGVRRTHLLVAWRVTVVVHFTGLSFSGNSDHSLFLAGLRRTVACRRWCPGSLL